MRSVEMPEAVTDLSALVAEAESGEEVMLTRAGKIVARIMPPSSQAVDFTGTIPAEQQQLAQEAYDRMQERARTLNLKFDWEEFKADRDYGRR